MKARLNFALAMLAILSFSQVASAQLAPGYGYAPQPMMAPMAPQFAPGFVPQPVAPVNFTAGGIPTVAPAAFSIGCDGKCGAGKNGCNGKSCNGCGGCKSCSKCGCGSHNHKFSLFGEFLYLRARDAEVAYGVEVDSAVAAGLTAIQVGRIGTVDPDYSPGFRTGINWCIDECSSMTLTYTMWEAGTSDSIGPVAPGNSIQSLVVHPLSLVANSTGTNASATLDLSMDLVDVDYRELISYDCDHSVSFLAGIRYAGFEQEFFAQTPINGNRTVATDIDFDGVGLRLGLEGERRVRQRGFLYSKLHGSLVAGEFRTSFDERDAFNASAVSTTWEGGRILSIVDLEVGAGWTSKCNNWKFSAGYVFSAWTGMVKTDEWITAVQTNNFDHLRDVMTFDGLTAKIEGRF